MLRGEEKFSNLNFGIPTSQRIVEAGPTTAMQEDEEEKKPLPTSDGGTHAHTHSRTHMCTRTPIM